MYCFFVDGIEKELKYFHSQYCVEMCKFIQKSLRLLEKVLATGDK